MKNETFARAMTEIDDALIEEAHTPLPRATRRRTVLSRYLAAAACFLFVLTAVLIFRGTGTPIHIAGKNIDKNGITLSAREVLAVTSPVARHTDLPEQEIKVPVRVSTASLTEITVTDGTLTREDNGEVFRAGEICRIDGETDFLWNVATVEDASYLMTVRDTEDKSEYSLQVDYRAEECSFFIRIVK